MHICYLTNEYPEKGKPHGGVGSFVYTIAHELVKKDVRVTVIGLHDIARESTHVEDGIRIVRLPLSKWKFASFVPNSRRINQKLWELMKSEEPIDIIEASELGLAFIDKKITCKKLIRMHGGHHFFAVTLGKKPSWWRGWQEIKSFRKATHVCAVSRFVAEETTKLLHLKKPIQIIYNPINLSRFYQSDPKNMVNHSLLFVGTVCEKKGIKQLIQSLEFLMDKYPDVHLNVVGRDWSNKSCPSYIHVLKSELPKKCIQSVTFMGPVEHARIPKLIEKAHVCVYPSHMEAMPIAWLEVLAMGKTFVGSKIGPGFEAVQENKTGLLCDPYSPISISEQVSFFFENPDLAQQYGRNARQDVLERFNIEVLVKNNLDFYQSCVEE